MPKDSFRFKQFVIQQDRCAMKVGTDGVLLGAWADVSKHSSEPRAKLSILDIGTGTGIISLMLAQRASEREMDFHIDAIEIDEAAAAQAQENVNASAWAQHIHIFPVSLQDFAQTETAGTYDMIVCNPPFYNATLKPDDASRAIARHKDSLPISEIAHFAKEKLSCNGRLALIYPSDYDSEVITAAILCGLHPIRNCDVLTIAGKPCKRRMTEFSTGKQPLQREQLVIRDANNKYTDEYHTLTERFYLHLSD